MVKWLNSEVGSLQFSVDCLQLVGIRSSVLGFSKKTIRVISCLKKLLAVSFWLFALKKLCALVAIFLI
jgi:hypothetical protein